MKDQLGVLVSKIGKSQKGKKKEVRMVGCDKENSTALDKINEGMEEVDEEQIGCTAQIGEDEL